MKGLAQNPPFSSRLLFSLSKNLLKIFMASVINLTNRAAAVSEIENFARVNCSMIVSGHAAATGASNPPEPDPTSIFKCKTCGRKFASFQALGGHRASHKKVKPAISGEFASPAPAKTPKSHACTICGQEFLIGQALGGHMRRHRKIDPVVVGGSIVTTEGSTENSDGNDLDLKKRKNDVELVAAPENYLSAGGGKRVCLDLDLNKCEFEIEEGESVEDDEKDLLKLELRQPINNW